MAKRVLLFTGGIIIILATAFLALLLTFGEVVLFEKSML